ncbi:zeta toxin, partial [Colletotrichum incanum]
LAHVTQKGFLPYGAQPLKLQRSAGSWRRSSSPTPLISKDKFVVHDESQVEKEARSPSQAQEKKDEGSLQINNSPSLPSTMTVF